MTETIFSAEIFAATYFNPSLAGLKAHVFANAIECRKCLLNRRCAHRFTHHSFDGNACNSGPSHRRYARLISQLVDGGDDALGRLLAIEVRYLGIAVFQIQLHRLDTWHVFESPLHTPRTRGTTHALDGNRHRLHCWAIRRLHRGDVRMGAATCDGCNKPDERQSARHEHEICTEPSRAEIFRSNAGRFIVCTPSDRDSPEWGTR
jgi:hypothetical protein